MVTTKNSNYKKIPVGGVGKNFRETERDDNENMRIKGARKQLTYPS